MPVVFYECDPSGRWIAYSPGDRSGQAGASPAQPADLSTVQQQVALSLSEMSLDDHDGMPQDPHSLVIDERTKMLDSIGRADDDLTVEIRNLGAGITPEQRMRLLEKFYHQAMGSMCRGCSLCMAAVEHPDSCFADHVKNFN